MTESELVALLGSKIEACLNESGDSLSGIRQENFDYYNGELYGNEREGHSKYVSREVLETVEWALPSLLRIFMSGDRVVTFDPVGPEDEAQAMQETDIVNYAVVEQCDGYLEIHNWFKDALLNPNGYLKVAMDESVEVSYERYQGLDENELSQIDAQPDSEIIEAEETTQVLMTPQGPMEVPAYDVRVKKTTSEPRLTIECVPPEQVLIDNDLTSLNVDKADFVCHRTKRTQTYLLQSGYSKEDLEEAGTSQAYDWDDEKVNRMFHADENPDGDSTDDDSERKYWVHECYVRVDMDDDGISEFRRILMIGSKIFENELHDYQPFCALASLVMPHKHAGIALAELVKDYQLIKSTLMRLLLDNAYTLNRNRKEVAEGALLEDGSTMDALLDPEADVIPVRMQGGILPIDNQMSMIGDILPVIQSLTDTQQVRTGVAPQLSLDPSTLQQSTMGAFTAAQSDANQRLEMIARTFAETGFRQMILKAHRLLKEYSQKPLAMKLNGQWVQANPMDWRDRRNVSVNVGLGFNNKDQKLNMLMQVLGLQREGLQVGLANTQNIYNTLEQVVETAGLSSVDKFFTNPKLSPPPEPKQDPNMILVQAEMMKAQTGAQKAQADAQIEQAKIQIERDRAQLEARERQFKLMQEAQKQQAESVSRQMDSKLKEAQTVKTLEEARKLDIENDKSVMEPPRFEGSM